MESRNNNIYCLEQESPLDLSCSIAPYPVPFSDILKEKHYQAEKVVSLKKNVYCKETGESKGSLRSEIKQHNNYGVLRIVEQKHSYNSNAYFQNDWEEVVELELIPSETVPCTNPFVDNYLPHGRQWKSVNPASSSIRKHLGQVIKNRFCDSEDRTLFISHQDKHWYLNNNDVLEENHCEVISETEEECPKTYSINDLLITFRMDILG